MTQTPVFDTITIIGAGLIGSSIARAAREYGAAAHVRVFDRDPEVRTQAATLGLGEVSETIDAACNGAALVVLAVPVGAMAAAAQDCASAMKAGAILSDVGSVKADPAASMSAAMGNGVHVVPGHPIAGTEKSGPSAGFASLFQGRWCILTPLEGQADGYDAAVGKVQAFWERLGSTVELMDVRRHDLVLSITSHLPHLIAYNIVATAEDMEQVTQGEVVKFSAGGFRDFTRIAASDPTMWRDIFLHNKEAVLETLGRFSEDLALLQRAIRWEDGETLFNLFTRSREVRRNIIEAGQDVDVADFGRTPAPGDASHDPSSPEE